MNSWNRTSLEDRRTYVNGNLVSTATNQIARSDVQNVTGFGNGDFVAATNGSFTHTIQMRTNGYQRSMNTAGTSETYVVGPNPNAPQGQGIPPPALDATEANNLINEALDKLYSKIRGGGSQGQPPMNAGVTVGESAETFQMVKGAVKAAHSVVPWAVKAYNDVTRKGKVVGRLADAWLAYQYGWKPLLSDIHGFATWSTRRFQYRTFRSTAKVDKPYFRTQAVSPYEHIIGTQEGFHRQAVLYSVTCSVSNQSAFDLERLTSMDPKVIAWELFPLSFVLDWFVDIGGYLANIEAASTSGLTFVRGFRTVSSINYYKHSLTGFEPGSGKAYTQMSYHASRRVTTKNRTRLLSFPRPAFPSVKVDLGVGQILSAGALIAKAFGPPGRR